MSTAPRRVLAHPSGVQPTRVAADGVRVAMALARHPDIVAAIKAADYDVVSHGWR